MAKVLIYAMNYSPEIAGVGRYTGEIGEHLAVAGHEVIVVTTPPHYPGWKLQGPYEPYRWTTERQGGQTIIRCPLHLREKMGGLWRLIAPLSFAINSAPVVIWQILVKRPDVLLCIEPTLLGAPAALAAARWVGATRVLHVQDLEIDASFAVGHLSRLGKLKFLALAFERACLKRFDKVITISRKMADRLVAKGVEEERVEIVHNWVDIDRIRPLEAPSPYRRELGLAETDRVVLYSGNVGAKQGFDTVIAAAERLADRPEIQFIIAGEGPAKAKLQARAKTLPNLRFLPFQPYARLSSFLGLADVHILPQSADAADLVLPSKLGGMLASGKPIVATAAQGTELAEFLAGAVVPPEDGDALAAAIAAALEPGGEDAAVAQKARLRLAGLLSRSDGLGVFERVATAGRREALAPPDLAVASDSRERVR